MSQAADALMGVFGFKRVPYPAWQPIETAPKDGSDVLIYNPVSGEMFVCYWSKGRWKFAVHIVMKDEPTHWMPLPEPPK